MIFTYSQTYSGCHQFWEVVNVFCFNSNDSLNILNIYLR